RQPRRTPRSGAISLDPLPAAHRLALLRARKTGIRNGHPAAAGHRRSELAVPHRAADPDAPGGTDARARVCDEHVRHARLGADEHSARRDRAWEELLLRAMASA